MGLAEDCAGRREPREASVARLCARLDKQRLEHRSPSSSDSWDPAPQEVRLPQTAPHLPLLPSLRLLSNDELRHTLHFPGNVPANELYE